MENDTVEEGTEGATHHSMHLLWDNHKELAIVFILTLVMGLPLFINKGWHLRVSGDRSGRGVIKLIQNKHLMSLLSIPVMIFNMLILLAPSQEIPRVACLLLEWAMSFLMMQRYHGGLPIALGR